MKIFRRDDDPQDKAKDFDEVAEDAKRRGEEKKVKEDERRWGRRAGQ